MAEAEFWGLFTPTPGVLEDFAILQRRYLASPDPIYRREVRVLLNLISRDMGSVANRYRAKTDQAIRRVLEAERKRPPTDKSRHLADNIQSQVYRLPGVGASYGAFGVARIDELDRTTNPEGGSDRPYWRVIEEGSEEWQPQMVGRELFGKFFGGAGGEAGPGAGSRPSQDRFRQDSSFIFGVTGSGIGLIDRPIHAQHYLERGMDAVEADYFAAIRAIGTRYAKRLIAIEDARAARALEASGFFAP